MLKARSRGSLPQVGEEPGAPPSPLFGLDHYTPLSPTGIDPFAESKWHTSTGPKQWAASTWVALLMAEAPYRWYWRRYHTLLVATLLASSCAIYRRNIVVH